MAPAIAADLNHKTDAQRLHCACGSVRAADAVPHLHVRCMVETVD
jgi:hypothetical protein